MSTCIIYFKKKARIKINPIHVVLKWMFLYYKYYVSIESTFLKEFMLIKLVYQKSVIFATIVIS